MAIVPAQTTNFRDMNDAIAPTWLRGPVGSRWRYAMSVLWDATADGVAYALRVPLPSLAPDDSLPWIATDRQIDRGFQEPHDHFVGRLQQWLDRWRLAGLPSGMLLAMLGYVYPDAIMVRVITNSGQYFTYAASAPDPMPPGTTVPTQPTKVTTSPNNWNWDGGTDPFYGTYAWWRAWIVLYPDSGLFPPPSKTWGTFNWGDGTCYGWAGTADQAGSITSLAAKWRPGGTWVPWVLVAYSSAWFDPTLTYPDAHLPDSHWGHYGKVVTDATWGKVYVPARPAASQVTFLDGAGNLEAMP